MLTKESIKLLKIIEKDKTVPDDQEDNLNGLLRAGYISLVHDSDGEWTGRYEITFEGKAFLSDLKIKSKRHWQSLIIPSVISAALSIVVSVATVYVMHWLGLP